MVESILFLPIAFKSNPLFIEFVICPNTCSTLTLIFDFIIQLNSMFRHIIWPLQSYVNIRSQHLFHEDFPLFHRAIKVRGGRTNW